MPSSSSHNERYAKDTFILEYENKGYLPEIKKQIIAMVLGGGDIRDTSRVLKISMNTVLSELKKENEIQKLNYDLLKQLKCKEIELKIVQVEAAEIDEMWNFVEKKEYQRWLWHAINHSKQYLINDLSNFEKLKEELSIWQSFYN